MHTLTHHHGFPHVNYHALYQSEYDFQGKVVIGMLLFGGICFAILLMQLIAESFQKEEAEQSNDLYERSN